MSSVENIVEVDQEKDQQIKDLTQLVYVLQAACFLLGITYIVAVIVNYVKRDSVRGTWVESHFRWQIRTFWFSALWFVVGCLTLVIIVGGFILAANCIWVIYRIVRGWLALNEKQPMYQV